MTRREMRREIDELRAALGLRARRTIEEWLSLPQAMRDRLAANAYLSESADKTRALIRLGFPAMNRLPPDKVHVYNDHIGHIFGTVGVEAYLKRALAQIDVDREAILSRLSQTALYGSDAESVRAASLLIRVCGWELRGDSTPDAARPTGNMSQPCLNRTTTQET